MSHDSLFAISRAGLDHERLRLEAAAQAIATADTPLAPGQATKAGPAFDAVLGSTTPVQERLVRDPSNPMADNRGFVHYPAVDLARQMSALVSASRAYEADVRAFNTLRSMEMDALNIGGTQS